MFFLNFLFISIIIVVCVLGYYIYLHSDIYINNISHIINANDKKKNILIGFFILCSFILCYEYNRNCVFSLVCMILFLIGLCGVIIVPDRPNMNHYSFALLIIIGALLYMKKNCINNILEILLLIQLLILLATVQRLIERNKDILVFELLLIFNFIFYYCYLHYLKYL